MNRLIAAVLSFFASSAFGATTLPIQLLNPSSSSSGQAVVSTGASTAPVWGGVGLNGIASIAANTVLANATSASASPSAFAMPGCSSASSAITWTTNTGFTCNTAIAATTLTGTTTAIASGNVGELQEPAATTGTNVPSNVSVNCSSMILSAGIWDISGTIQYVPSGSTTLISPAAGISTTSATIGNFDTYVLRSGSGAVGVGDIMTTPIVPFVFTTTTTVYLVGGSGVSSGGTSTCNGRIRARRAG